MKIPISPEGLVLIDKPRGMTSFDVIRILRRKLNIRKMGHAGTLDPLASGLLIVGVGPGTKQMASLVGLDKVYEVSVFLGEKRDTGDLEGYVVEEGSVDHLTEEFINKTIAGMSGICTLPVPRYSAVKVEGRPLYARARAGEAFNPPLRAMEIYALDVNRIWFQGKGCLVEVCMHVSSGSYVRSISEEIGRRLSVPATTRVLRRTKIGRYSVRDAVVIE